MQHRSPPKTALFAGAFGIALASSAAHAQSYGPPPGYQGGQYQGEPSENVYVTVPRFRGEQTPLNAPPGKVSLSTAVRYDDIDLRTRQGARKLRLRVRDAARDMCARLYDAYPFQQATGTSCYKTALEDALVHANEAIGDARRDWRRYRE
jgi:UrcA family protein